MLLLPPRCRAHDGRATPFLPARETERPWRLGCTAVKPWPPPPGRWIPTSRPHDVGSGHFLTSGYEELWRTRTRTLDSHVSRLCSKLEREPGDRFVVNVWGVANIGSTPQGSAVPVPTQYPNQVCDDWLERCELSLCPLGPQTR